MTRLSKDDQAPHFEAPDQQGKTTAILDFKGKWIVLYFYPKDNTPGCTLEAIDFTAKKKDFEALGAVVIGVSPDTVASHQRFCEKKSLGIILLSDENKKISEAYDAWGLKKLYAREFMGIIRSTALISPDGKIAFLWPNVKVKGHADAVLDKIRELKD